MKIDGTKYINKNIIFSHTLFHLFPLGSLRTKVSIRYCSLGTWGMIKPDNRV